MSSLLAFAASTRKGSFNQQAVDAAAEGARSAGAQVTALSLADYPLPLYDQDLEASEGQPAPLAALRDLFVAHDGLLIAVPEYNGFFPPLFKNTLDWLSRPDPDGGPSPFAGKVAAVVSASPGGLGGMRGLPHAKLLLQNLGVLVLPQSHAVGGAGDVFDADDFPTSRHATSLKAVGHALAETTAKLQ